MYAAGEIDRMTRNTSDAIYTIAMQRHNSLISSDLSTPNRHSWEGVRPDIIKVVLGWISLTVERMCHYRPSI